VSVLYRPVEQLLARTIADRAARGEHGTAHLRIAATIQLGLGAAWVAVALAAREPIQQGLFGGSSTLYWVLVVTVVAYAASYFARGFLAGHRRFAYYGGLVLMESLARVSFAVAAVLGLATGAGVVALGLVAAPIVSLAVVPLALGRRLRSGAAGGAVTPSQVEESAPAPARAEAEFTLSRGGSFAASVLVIMAAEQTFLNAGPLVVKATSEGTAGAVLAGFVFNVLLIARAPLQLFQSVQTAILPHLTRLRAGGETDPFRRSVQVTLLAVALFAGAAALGMLALGPWVMGLVFDDDLAYGRPGLVVVALGMGLYLAAATLNQAALARAHAGRAAVCWATSAGVFVILLLVPGVDDRLLQVELAFFAGAALLAGLLYGLYRRSF
jgi:O-antigen/teichoic acid export membrane protein